jgi:hypothetical protein
MTDIVDILKESTIDIETGEELCPGVFGHCTVEDLKKAAQTIQNLRSALRKIGYDYVELSYEKVQLLYIEHISIARKAYQESFHEQSQHTKIELNDDF